MLSRQRTILGMLASAGPKRSKLDLVKLIFLLSEHHSVLPATTLHEFLPYKRGPYSFTLYYDIGALERAGYVLSGEQDVALTRLGRSEAERTNQATKAAVDHIKKSYGHFTTDDLIDYVYEMFPWYTLNSDWIERRNATRPKAEIKVYTTGYEDMSLDGLLNRLLQAGIQRLIDVRANPVARRYGFHKSTLTNSCPKVGIEYFHFPELGVPSSWRAELESYAAYQQLFKRYTSEILPGHSTIIQNLTDLILSAPSALMCKEANPQCCHRTTLAEAIGKQTGLKVEDLQESRKGETIPT